MKKRTRADDVFEAIKRHAETFPGSTPTQQELAEDLGLSQQRVNYLLMRLRLAGKIEYIKRHSYFVPRSTWEPPTDS